MSTARVDAVIAAVERGDAALANWMRVAADGLTAGEGEELITQAGLQRYLWYDLPRRHPDHTWRPVAEAAGVLLSLLGLDRYADIARSTTTSAVLDVWGDASGKGFAAFRSATIASGVEPPDTERLAWGEVFGTEEAWALQAVEVALERAIVAGEFQPGRGSWRKVAARICDGALLAPAGDGGATLLQAVLEERADSWVAQGRSAELKAWRQAARARMDHLDPVDVEPSEFAHAIAPMRWLLQRSCGGVPLTQAGYLPPAVVHEAADRFGWWEFRGRPRSEVDGHQLGVLRDTVTRLPGPFAQVVGREHVDDVVAADEAEDQGVLPLRLEACGHEPAGRLLGRRRHRADVEHRVDIAGRPLGGAAVLGLDDPDHQAADQDPGEAPEKTRHLAGEPPDLRLGVIDRRDAERRHARSPSGLRPRPAWRAAPDRRAGPGRSQSSARAGRAASPQ